MATAAEYAGRKLGLEPGTGVLSTSVLDRAVWLTTLDETSFEDDRKNSEMVSRYWRSSWDDAQIALSTTTRRRSHLALWLAFLAVGK